MNKMNKIVIISLSLILVLVAGLAGCIAPPAKTAPEAAVTITDWYQEGYYLYIYYVVENTGDIDINMYDAYFTVKCKGDKEFYPQDYGLSVPVGKKISDDCGVDVGENQVISVEITNWALLVIWEEEQT